MFARIGSPQPSFFNQAFERNQIDERFRPLTVQPQQTRGQRTQQPGRQQSFHAQRFGDSFSPFPQQAQRHTRSAPVQRRARTQRQATQPRAQAPRAQPMQRTGAPQSVIPSRGPSGSTRTPWISQFDGSRVPGAGNTACKRASEQMLKAAGVTPTNNMISGSRMSSYIDSQLAQGKPVMTTVNHNGRAHVVVITGKGNDANGSYYQFQEPGTRNPAIGSDQNPNNRFRIGANGSLTRRVAQQGQYVYQQNYSVNFVRQNQ